MDKIEVVKQLLLVNVTDREASERPARGEVPAFELFWEVAVAFYIHLH